MSEIEINTSGEIIAEYEVVGLITWKQPFAGSTFAGSYIQDFYFQGMGSWDDGEGCEMCGQQHIANQVMRKKLEKMTRKWNKLRKKLKKIRGAKCSS